MVIFWSDHGYAHGEKGHWGKHTLWQRTSQVPFIWAGPGVARGQDVSYTTTLIDIYPTLVEMCGLPEEAGLEGESLARILKTGKSPGTSRSVLLPYDVPDSYAVINEAWRYIRYRDGAEELYDVRNDPHEWDNRAADVTLQPIKRALRARAPATFAAAGLPSSRFRLVPEGEDFAWIPKSRQKSAAPGTRKK